MLHRPSHQKGLQSAALLYEWPWPIHCYLNPMSRSVNLQAVKRSQKNAIYARTPCGSLNLLIHFADGRIVAQCLATNTGEPRLAPGAGWKRLCLTVRLPLFGDLIALESV